MKHIMNKANAKKRENKYLPAVMRGFSWSLLWSFLCAFVGIVGCGKLKLNEDHYLCDPDGGTAACPTGWVCRRSETGDTYRCFRSGDDGGFSDAAVDAAHIDAAHVDAADLDAAHVDAAQGESCPEGWVYIPAGDFEMGCNNGDPCWEGFSNESPRHKVTLSAYCIQRTEVSVAQYRECKDSGGCTGTPTEGGGTSWCNWTSSEADREDHPINCINWSDAREYCQWAGGDLPTEAQWEKAARGTDQRTYPWGEAQPTCDRCNWNHTGSGSPYGCNDAEEGPGTWPVGYLITTAGDSPYGLKDMVGNVWEWVLDCYDENFYSSCEDNCVDPVNSTSGCDSYRVIRGGGFYYGLIVHIRVVYREYYTPTADYYDNGFRCARTPE